jgi:hypothetical protein
MIDRIAAIAGAALVLAMATGPAMAGTAAPPSLPEPATMTLFGLGAAGAFIANRVIRRK